MTEALKNYVEDHPEVEEVFFKDKKELEWTLQADKNHPIKKSREYILSGTPDAKKAKSADDLITAINAAETPEEAEAAAEGDTRGKVIKALTDKLATFASA